eukprot:3433971-Rhodomonas_salina.1
MYPDRNSYPSTRGTRVPRVRGPKDQALQYRSPNTCLIKLQANLPGTPGYGYPGVVGARPGTRGYREGRVIPQRHVPGPIPVHYYYQYLCQLVLVVVAVAAAKSLLIVILMSVELHG